MPKKKEIPKPTQDLIRTFAVSFATLERKNTDLAGWLQLKFSCDRKTAVWYADWWEREQL
jgi:hypothetical protein